MAEELGSLWKESVTVGWSESDGMGVLTVKEPEKSEYKYVTSV
jgi:hypothetical protein